MTDEDFKCPSSGGFYPVPGQCTNQYYTCLDGIAYVSVSKPIASLIRLLLNLTISWCYKLVINSTAHQIPYLILFWEFASRKNLFRAAVSQN